MYDDKSIEEEIEGNEEIKETIGIESEEVEGSEELKEIDEINEDSDDENESLPFAKAEVVRLMKQNLDKDKMIRERVKVEMNNFLGDVLRKVCKQLNEYPYTTIEYEMLKESIYPYTNIERINQEKERILLHLNAIKADCNALSADVIKTLKIKDTLEEEDEDFKTIGEVTEKEQQNI
ncbi:MAG: hypothetical protein LBB45_08930 [Methanobrevibacter sp.]|nr:hypothetical protein [Candidatus Methanovirga basalitermitum]